MNLFESTASKVKRSHQTEDNNTEHNTTKFVNDSYCDNIIANIDKYRKMAAMNSKEENSTVNNNDDEDNVLM
jgi:transcription-repair coupling factor (superfamily II helicase)